MSTLTKKELALAVSDQMGYSKRVSRQLVNEVFKYISNALSEGKKVKIVRFGTLQVLEKRPRLGTSLKDGSPIQIPARTTVVFRPSRTLKGVVNACTSEKILPNRRGK